MSTSPGASSQQLLRTPLHESHVMLGARMVPFAGWEMPVSYPIGTVAEVKACRTSVGLFDVSHMGEVVVIGSDAARFVDFATTNSVDRLEPGEAQYSLLLNDDGKVIDDIIVYKFSDSNFLIVVNASRQHEDFARFSALATGFDVKVEDVSFSKGLIAIQGPNALNMIQEVTSQSSVPGKRFSFIQGRFDGSAVLFSRTGYTGEDGVEILCDISDTLAIWTKLIELGGVPCGLGARDVLRLEAGYPLYGHELDEAHSPFESGGGWVVKLAKGEFAGRDTLVAQKAALASSKLVGLQAISPANAIPRQDCIVETADGQAIGTVTSGTMSPIIGAGIALARVKADYAKLGTELVIDIRGRKVGAKVVRTPFVQTTLSGG